MLKWLLLCEFVRVVRGRVGGVYTHAHYVGERPWICPPVRDDIVTPRYLFLKVICMVHGALVINTEIVFVQQSQRAKLTCKAQLNVFLVW